MQTDSYMQASRSSTMLWRLVVLTFRGILKLSTCGAGRFSGLNNLETQLVRLRH